jgi:hypothetical protein
MNQILMSSAFRVLAILWPPVLTLLLWMLPSYFPLSYSSTVNFGCLLFLPSLCLAAIGFGLIGVIAQSLACIFLSFWISLKTHQGLALWQTFFFLGTGGCLSYLLVLFQKEIVEKKIILNDFEGHFNDFSIKYAKHKASIRAFKNKIARFSTLRLLGEKLLSTLPFDETAQKTLELTKDLILKGDITTLFLLDDTLKNFKITHEFSLTEQGKAITAHPRDLFNTWTIRNRQNLLVEDLASDFRFEGISREAAPGSLIQAPLITEDKLIGAIRISSLANQSFTLEDLRILATLASVVSASLKNAKLYSETLELSIRDGLTGLFVFTYFHEELQKAFEETQQKQGKLPLLMADIDDFKKINDQYGHTVGDMILPNRPDLIRNPPRNFSHHRQRRRGRISSVRFNERRYASPHGSCALSSEAKRKKPRLFGITYVFISMHHYIDFYFCRAF